MTTTTTSLTRDLAGWYSNTSNSSASSEEILSSTFANAKSTLQKLLKPQDFSVLFPPTAVSPSNTAAGQQQHVASHTIFDVHRCLKDAQESYESRIGHSSDEFSTLTPSATAHSDGLQMALGKPRPKVRMWLTGLSEKLLYYGNIFDTLAQHHPEYVALAWGTLKFLFVAIINHATTASKLSTSISQIADILPQHSLHLILYPTPEMQAAVARLYASIMRFFLSALQWYNDSRATHAIKSIFQPWDIRFKGEHEAIAAAAQQVERLADVALKAEMRDTRLEVVKSREDWEVVRREMSELKEENRRWHQLWKDSIQEMQGSIFGMYKEIHLDLTSQRATLSRIHLNQMLTLPFWNSLPTSGESLQFCRSMRKRRRERIRLPLPDINRLNSWNEQQSNAVLLIDAQNSLIAKTFMIDLIDLILDSRLEVIWALRFASYWERPMSATDIARMLVLQAMQAGADRLLNSPFPLTVEQLREAAALDEWVMILNHVLAGSSHVYIILDADLLAHAMARERSQTMEMLDLLRLRLPGNIKIVIATSSVSQGYAEELEDLNACIRIQTGTAEGWRKPRRPWRPVTRFRRW